MFWIFAGGLTALTLAAMLWPLLRPSRQTAMRSSYDVQIYKDQLKEVEADLARGTLSEAEAKASRTEVSRRLLAAADAEASESSSGNAPKSISRALAITVSLAVLVGGFGVYQQLGVQGMPDFPLEDRVSSRPSQAVAEKAVAQDAVGLPDIVQIDPKHLELVEQLQEVLQDRPDDLRGHQMLADNLAQLGKYADARVAQDTVMRILGDEASAEDYAAHAEIMIVAANWYVSPAAEQALVDAFQTDPSNMLARYYAGVLMIQRQDYAQTYSLWSGLLEEGPADAPWIALIENQIEAVAAEAGITPSTLSGPSSDQVDAAGDMTDAERNDMIRGMVTQLSERLAAEGGTAEEWARLIRAYGVLGETAKASKVWNEAKEVFATNPDNIALLLEAARDAEVSAR
ncbi:c-type cytochrome biogenesis protein CcmI [Rhodobacterales bacterium 52_120_T64]|nr:c-type cytochrome biogenesis protein CcmI [Rhodobacterales bacterium 52_120_T64]